MRGSQVTKYGMRSGWTHRDVLRLSHPKPAHIRTAAQRQATAAAAGALETLAVQSAPAGGDEDEWALLDVPSPAAAAAATPAAGDAAVPAADSVERNVADMQLLFDFIVKDEAAPAGEGAAKLEGYLASAHRLKKASASDITASAGEGRTEGPPQAAPLAQKDEKTTKKRKAKVDPAAGAEEASGGGPPEVKRPRVEDVTVAEACALITKHRFSRWAPVPWCSSVQHSFGEFEASWQAGRQHVDASCGYLASIGALLTSAVPCQKQRYT